MMKCPYCGAKVLLKDASFIYHTNESKKWGKIWVCSKFPKCNAYVGCHKGTEIPLGRLANEKLRTLKAEAHRQFDPIWKSGLMSRKDAYRWLANMLHISLEDCHIGMFDVKMCQRVIQLCKKQDKQMINDYRIKAYGYAVKRPTFTRGYNNRNKHNK